MFVLLFLLCCDDKVGHQRCICHDAQDGSTATLCPFCHVPIGAAELHDSRYHTIIIAQPLRQMVKRSCLSILTSTVDCDVFTPRDFLFYTVEPLRDVHHIMFLGIARSRYVKSAHIRFFVFAKISKLFYLAKRADEKKSFTSFPAISK